MLANIALVASLTTSLFTPCTEPAQPLTLFPDTPDWYVLDIGETGCEKYGWPIDCGADHDARVQTMMDEEND